MDKKPLIFLTNDDGVHAKGLRELMTTLQPLGRLFVVAPQTAQSGMSHAITMTRPLFLQKLEDTPERIVYSCNGYYMTTSYGRDSKNARRDIPKAMLMTVPTLIVLYVGVAMAGSRIMTLEEYGESTTLVFAAQRVFPTWLFILFIIGGPIMALLSTLNSSFAYNAINIGQSCDDGWLPAAFGKKNKAGARVWILTFMYVVGLIPIVFGFSIEVITNMVQLITSAFAILNMMAYVKLPKKYPTAWKKARLHVADGLYYAICWVSFAFFMVVLWKSCLSMSPALAAANVIAIVVLAGIGLWRSKTGNITIHTSVWSGEESEDNAHAAQE